MHITVEISMYPLREDFIPAIDGVIGKLNSFEGIKVETFATATLLAGNFDTVMDAVRETLAWSYAQYGSAVFVTKFLPGYEAGADDG